MVNNKSFIVLFLQLIQTFLAAVTIIIIARLLGAKEYGRYIYLITSSSILPLLAGLGSEHVFIMEASKRKLLIPYLFGNAFFIRLIVTVVSVLLVCLYLVIFGSYDFWIVILMTSGSLVAVFANPLFISLYRVKGLHIRPWVICFITPISYLIYLFIVSRISLSIFLVSLGFFISNIFAVIIFVIDTNRIIKMKISIKLIKRYFTSGLIFSVSQVFDFAFARLDIFLLQFFAGNYAVGIYAAGQRVVSIFQIIPSSFHVVELPEFHRSSSDSALLLKKFRDLRLLLLELSLIVFGLLIINSSSVIKILFGEAYTEAMPVVELLSLSGVLLFVNYPYYMLAEAINKIKQRMYIRIFTFLLTLILVTVLIKLYGIKGAAYGLLGGQLLFMILLHILTQQANGGIRIILFDFKMILIAIVAGLMGYYSISFIENILFQITISSSIYLLLFIVSGHLLGYLQITKLIFSLFASIKKLMGS